jgi:hypothetical protein
VVDNGSSVKVTQNIAITNTSAGRGVIANNGSSINAVALTNDTSGTDGIYINNGSSVVLTGLTANISSQSSGSRGIYINGSSLDTFTMQTLSNVDTGMTISNDSRVRIYGNSSHATNGTHGILMENGSSLVSVGNITLDGNANGIGMIKKCNLTANDLLTTVPNTVYGLSMFYGSKAVVKNTSTATGTSGDVLLGVNAVATWANIATNDLQYITDYFTPLYVGKTPSQLCDINTF